MGYNLIGLLFTSIPSHAPLVSNKKCKDLKHPMSLPFLGKVFRMTDKEGRSNDAYRNGKKAEKHQEIHLFGVVHV